MTPTLRCFVCGGELNRSDRLPCCDEILRTEWPAGHVYATRAVTPTDATPQPGPDAEREARPFSWTRCANVDEMQAFFLSRLPVIRDAARTLGYAIGLHGSTRRDLDLIAAPWTDSPSPKDELASAVQFAACGLRPEQIQWTEKPGGRYAVSMPCCWTEFGYGVPNLGLIDLSVMSAAGSALTARAERAEAERDAALAREARLREENARLDAWARERHDRWRAAENVIYTMKYPDSDADLIDAVANEINCGEVAGECDYGHIEYDTNAHVCSREDKADEPLGCRWNAACQLRDLAKALRARAALSSEPQPAADAGERG